MTRRVVIGGALALVLIYGLAFAVRNAQVAANVSQQGGGPQLLFTSASWLIWAALFAGLLAAGFTSRTGPRIEGERVLRHDDVAIFEHWANAAATVILIVSGFALGALMLPRFVSGTLQTGIALDIHFIGSALFAFAATYYVANALLSGRWREHIPADWGASVREAIAHYRAVLGKSEPPAADKYFASEHLSYPIAVIAAGALLLTGLVKVAAYSVAVPGALMGVTTIIHGIAAIALVVFFVAHLIATAILPSSWPLLRSMATGYVSADYARKHHKAWFDELTGPGEDGGQPGTDRQVA